MQAIEGINSCGWITHDELKKLGKQVKRLKVGWLNENGVLEEVKQRRARLINQQNHIIFSNAKDARIIEN